ncbi:hypothetical protein Tco_0662913 [Tanacetum coccineum]
MNISSPDLNEESNTQFSQIHRRLPHLFQITKRRIKLVIYYGLMLAWDRHGTTTNVLAEAYQRAKPTAARGGTNTPGNHKLLHPFRNSRVVVCGSSVITELVKVGQPNRPVTKGNAYGKGKHKIASIIDNAKDKVMETEEHAKQTTRGAVRKAKKAASVTFRKAKETVYEYEERAKDVVGLGDTKEKVFEKVTGHTAGESLGKTKDSVAHGIGLKQASSRKWLIQLTVN